MNALTDLAYVLPVRLQAPADPELLHYLDRLARWVGSVIVADGSEPAVFAAHAATLPRAVTHVPVAHRVGSNGKVLGVLAGMEHVRTPFVVIADDDVRHTPATLALLRDALRDTDIVRPQNVFRPRRWHTFLDEGRTLLARAFGGDWPGTLAVRSTTFRRCGGYRADVLFENLELVRTICTRGGSAGRLDDLFVVRRPPTSRKYLAQRTRQAYDEFARPATLAVELALLPAFIVLARRVGTLRAAFAAALAVQTLAEFGRRRSGGVRAFSIVSTLLSPFWCAERAVTSWIALGFYLTGGMPYAGTKLK